MENTFAMAKRVFSAIIWNSELENLTLSEYLNAYPSENEIWMDMVKKCREQGINLWEVRSK